MAQGLERHGCKITWREDRAAYKPKYCEPHLFDMAMTDGVREPMCTMVEEYNAEGLPVIVTDMGFLNRYSGYQQVGLDGLNWVPPEPCGPERFDKLGIDLKPRQAEKETVLICGQKPYDGQHHMGPEELRSLYESWAEQIAFHTNKRIIFRTHPRCPDMKINGAYNQPPTDTKNGGLDSALRYAHAVVAYNSTACTDALIAGVPFFCMPSTQAFKLSNGLDFSKIDEPYFPSDSDRREHLNRVAFAQWTAQEMQKGEAAEFILENVKRGNYRCQPKV